MRKTVFFPHKTLRYFWVSNILLFVILGLGSPCASANSSDSTHPLPLGVNGDWDWVNLINGISGWISVGNAASVPQDSSGWPTSDAGFAYDQRKNMPWRAPDALGINEDIAGIYHLSFTGQATIVPNTESSLGGLLVLNQRYDAAQNRTTADLLLQPGHFLLQLQLLNTKRFPGSPNGSGFTNLRLIRPGYPENSREAFTRSTLQAYQPPFAAVRFLNVDGANNYQTFFGSDLVSTRWEDRVQVTDAYQAGIQLRNTNGKQSQGVAWEYMIMLANATHHDMWINIPVSADDDYVTQLANLIYSGNQYTRGLDPNLNVYVEYSNEVWNFGFPQYVYNLVQANQEGISVDQRYIERTIQIAKIFESTFSETNGRHRVRPVALWQYMQELTFFHALAWAEQRLGLSANEVLYGIGQASYYDASDTSTVPATFATMRTGSDSLRRDLLGWQAVATFYGLQNVSYESGPGSLAAGTGAYTIRNWKMLPSITHHFLDNWFSIGGNITNYYALRGAVSEFGDWLLVEDFEHLNTPTYLGALAVLNSPTPDLAAGYLLPYLRGQTVSIDPSQRVPDIFANEAQPGSGLTITSDSPNLYLLRANASGLYSIQLYGHANTSSAVVTVSIDDKPLGNLALSSSDGFSSSLPVALQKGFHTLWLGATTEDTTTLPSGTGTILVGLLSGGGAPAVPSPPTNLAVTAGNSQVMLSWATTTTAKLYTIARSSESGGPYIPMAAVTSNTYTDTAVSNGHRYYYVVYAMSPSGSSRRSSQVSAFPASAQPAPPSNLNLLAGGGDFDPFYGGAIAILSWPSVPNAAGYNVYRSTDGTNFTLLTPSPQSGLEYTDLSISNGSTYSYAVTAVNYAGESSRSALATATPEEAVRKSPEVEASNRDGFIFLRWKPDPLTTPQFGTAFNVKRSESPDGPFSTILQINTYNAYDYSAVPDKTYYYLVTATNGAGESSPSNVVSAQADKPGWLGFGSGSSDIPEEDSQ